MSYLAAALLVFFALPPQAKEPPSIATARQDPRFHALVEKQFLAYEASLTTHCKDIRPDWSRATHAFL